MTYEHIEAAIQAPTKTPTASKNALNGNVSK
jgi:hypothetical protein